jgi:hypothetical protein
MADARQWFGEGPSGAAAEQGLVCSRQVVRQVLDRPGYAFSDAEVLENLRSVTALAAVVEAVKLAFVAELNNRPDALMCGVQGGKGAVLAFLTEGLNQSRRQACRDLAAAEALASASPDLPLMGQALADGLVSREHVDVAVATVRRVPKALKVKLIEESTEAVPADGAEQADGVEPADGEPAGEGRYRRGVEIIDEVLTGQARRLPPSTIDRLGRQIVHRLDPARAERFDADAVLRRSCSIGSDFTGMGLYRLVLDPVTHLQIRSVIAKFAAPRPAGSAATADGEEMSVRDTRTVGQRQADAMADLILRGAGVGSLIGAPAGAASPESMQRAQADSGRADDWPADGGPSDGGPGDGGPGSEASAENASEADSEPCSERDGTDQADAARSDSDFGSDVEPQEPLEEFQARGASIPPAFGAPGACGVEMTVIATLEQLAAALGGSDPEASEPGDLAEWSSGAGLARMSLAGRIGDYPGATLSPGVLARLSCDSALRRVLLDQRGAVLHLGRSRRLASRAQRQALAARDGGCAVPGCAVPPEWADVHHVVPWEQGGLTDIDAMVLLCGRHHIALHAGVYQIEMSEGLPWVRVPSWQDPARPWLRNTTHDHPQIADTLARILLTGKTRPPARRSEPPPSEPPPSEPPPSDPTTASEPDGWTGAGPGQAA